MVKNTGIPENQLSDLDYPQVLQDSHNKAIHALDVNLISDLPADGSKVTYEFKDMGDGTFETEFINYYGNGTKQQTSLEIRTTFQGTGEITLFSLIGATPAGLSATYATIYDDVGSVGILFRLDGGSTGTSGAARDIIVDIATGDSTSDMAGKLATTMNSDSKFSGAAVSALATIQSSTIGNKTDATAGDSGLGLSITDGTANLNNQYILLNSANDITEYYIWFDFNSTGTDPAIAGKTGIEIDFTIGDSYEDLMGRISTVVGALDDFNTEYDAKVFIQAAGVGTTTATVDGNSGSTISAVTTGTAGSLLGRIQIYFDTNNFITGYERIV
jgi:hypothetical protein